MQRNRYIHSSALNSSLKRLGVFLPPVDGMLVHRRVFPSIEFAGNHLYTRVERGTVRVSCQRTQHHAIYEYKLRENGEYYCGERYEDIMDPRN